MTLTGWYLNAEVGSEEDAALFEAILQVNQVPALLQLVANHENLVPCLAFAAPQDLIVNQERKELVLDSASLPQFMEDLFDGKQKHRCCDKKVGKVKDNPIDLRKDSSNSIESVAHLIHEAVFVDPPSIVNAVRPGIVDVALISRFVSSTMFLVQTRVAPEGG